VSVQEAASQSCGLPLFSSSDAQSIGSGDRSFFLVQWVLVFVQGQTDLKLQPALCFSMHHQLLTAFFFFFRSCKTTNYDWHPWIRCFRQSRLALLILFATFNDLHWACTTLNFDYHVLQPRSASAVSCTVLSETLGNFYKSFPSVLTQSASSLSIASRRAISRIAWMLASAVLLAQTLLAQIMIGYVLFSDDSFEESEGSRARDDHTRYTWLAQCKRCYRETW
jgi:hypothetical protein